MAFDFLRFFHDGNNQPRRFDAIRVGPLWEFFLSFDAFPEFVGLHLDLFLRVFY